MYCIAAAAVYVYNVYVGQQVYRLGRGASSFFFLIGLLTSSCHAEASFDLYDDDTNGPGSEPPPHHHTHRITSAMPWRRSRRAAGRWPPVGGSRALLAFLAKAVCCQCEVPEQKRLSFNHKASPLADARGRSTEDPPSNQRQWP